MKPCFPLFLVTLALAVAGCGSNDTAADDDAANGTPKDSAASDDDGAGDAEGSSATSDDDEDDDSAGYNGAATGTATGTGTGTGMGTGTSTGSSSGAMYTSTGGTSSSYADARAADSAEQDESQSNVGAAGAAAAGDEPVVVEEITSNPFVVVEHDPLSTFAADVDTASYDLFRQYVQAGSLPPASGVRLEEYVNYFSYDYPAPAADSETPFSISLAAAPTIMDRDTVLLRVGIQGRLAPEDEKKATNLVFLVDVSGSMDSPEKLPLVKYTLLETLDVLAPTDTVAIVAYASNTRVVLEPTPVSNRTTIEQEIETLAAGGSTAGAAGLELAYQQATAGFIEGGINHIVLCTDGDFNVGISSTEELLTMIKEKRESGVTLTALGYGTNNDPMMEAVSDAGNGIYGVITDEDQATSYVNKRMLSTLVRIAKDMKLQVEFNPDEVYAYRLLGYVDRAIADADFRNDVVDAGEVGAGHRVTALYELVLTGNDIPTAANAPATDKGSTFDGEAEVDPSDMVLVKVRYKDVDAEATDEALEVAQSLAPSDVAESYADLDTDFQWAIAVASFAEIVGQSPYADVDNLDTIKSIVGRPVYEDDPDRAEFATLLDDAIALLGSSSTVD